MKENSVRLKKKTEYIKTAECKQNTQPWTYEKDQRKDRCVIHTCMWIKAIIVVRMRRKMMTVHVNNVADLEKINVPIFHHIISPVHYILVLPKVIDF